MKIQTVISIFLCNILILCLFSNICISSSASFSSDWPDGTFQGTWNKKNDNTSGFIYGTFNQARRPTCGIFASIWNTTEKIGNGTFNGIYYGIIITGQWYNFKTKENYRLTGLILMNQTHFSARLINPSTGLIYISGAHDSSFLPNLTGSYGVGVKSMHLIDNNRSENFTTDPDDFRELMIQIWYPIEKNTQGVQTQYMDYKTFKWLKNRSPIPLITIPNNAYFFVRPHGRNQAHIAYGNFPVVIFSPGYDGVYQIYTSFIEDLVSHGFVVVSINHPYVSGITVFPDGRTVGLADAPTDPEEKVEFFNMLLRTIVQDAKFVLNEITDLNSSDPDFLGHFDLSKIGMYGHSFGGANTAVCCYEDPRFCSGLTLDGVFYQNFIPGNITVPFLFMFAEAHLSNNSTIMYMWNHTTNDTFKMNISGSTHYAFTDVGVLLSHLVPLIPPRLLLFGTIAPKRMVNITRTYVTVFFEVYLKGEPIDKLLNLKNLFDEVNFEYKINS